MAFGPPTNVFCQQGWCSLHGFYAGGGACPVCYPPVRTGWQCPSCLRILSPWTSECVHCAPGLWRPWPRPSVTYRSSEAGRAAEDTARRLRERI